MTDHSLWDRLDAELDAWQKSGRTAWLWWRDDDAAEVTPALDRLLELQQRNGIPLTLAVIPQQATVALADRLRPVTGICAAQHGFSHRNHAAPGEKKSEFPASRPVADCIADLKAGRQRLQTLLGDRVVSILVPPWNRMTAELLPALASCGFAAISAFTARETYWAAPGLVRLNTHLDPVDWRGGNADHGIKACLETTLQLLAALRHGEIAPQPLGLLSHHLRHDATGWAFLAEFLSRTASHPAGRWISAAKALEIGQSPQIVMPAS